MKAIATIIASFFIMLKLFVISMPVQAQSVPNEYLGPGYPYDIGTERYLECMAMQDHFEQYECLKKSGLGGREIEVDDFWKDLIDSLDKRTDTEKILSSIGSIVEELNSIKSDLNELKKDTHRLYVKLLDLERDLERK